jgi:hypothetical protein
MSRSLGNIIADSLALSLNYSRRMLVGVTPDQFARFARPGGQIVQSNHAAFVYGHLSLYSSRIIEQLDAEASILTPTDRFQTAFSKDAQCVDDPTGEIYPAMNDITEAYFQGYEAALAVLREAPDSALQKPNPSGGRMTELFPTLGSMQAFYVGGHIMLHLGQVSAWRRMLGLGAA